MHAGHHAIYGHEALEVSVDCRTHWSFFFQLCQRSIWPESVVLALCPHPKTLILDRYTELSSNFFLIKASLSEIYEENIESNFAAPDNKRITSQQRCVQHTCFQQI